MDRNDAAGRSAPDFVPYVPADSFPAEFTPRAVVAGALFGILFVSYVANNWEQVTEPGMGYTGSEVLFALNPLLTFSGSLYTAPSFIFSAGITTSATRWFYRSSDGVTWEQFPAPLAEQDWVVHLQSAPAGCEGPQAVLKYLSRYVSGAAISDRRLLADEDALVTFRAKNYRQGRRRKTLQLSGQQFVRRWMLHVLPPGFVRVRYYGLLANADRAARLTRCRELLAASGTPAAPPSSAAPEPAAERASACPRCQVGRLRLISRDDRPSWREVLNRSPYTHRWDLC